ncbi:glucose dehydrogenase [FAD, quinone]-like [Uranotaenia lowii]|uniref:glucose dehydrogenase [FAD, quinone]-like n=1 Tax=Uranotaenia lowii TaxID=190385 RepID=UPI00247AFC41|nr:glucose dehydrogenase [FAD, quinone]-like [Uranotaenia lowii]
MSAAGILPFLLALGNQSAEIASDPEAFNSFSAGYMYGDPTASYPDTSDFRNEYDFIIVGAGSGGCVMANRLSENPNWNVLLLEAGVEENFLLSVPLLVTLNVQSDYNWKDVFEPTPSACSASPGGVCFVWRGRGLGGSSLLNYMIYTRAHYRDFDQWAKEGSHGWNYSDVKPYFEKAEKSYVRPSLQCFETPFNSDFRDTVTAAGYKEITFTNKSLLGYYKFRTTTVRGQRNSAARMYLHPVRKRPNLHISVRSQVTKVLIDPEKQRAFGVEFVKEGKTVQVRAKKEVIVSAGAIGSPQILLLSGLGPPEDLSKFKIPVIKSLPVGNNLHDHYSAQLPFQLDAKLPRISIDEALETYIKQQSGIFAQPSGSESLAFLKTNNSKLPRDYPDYEVLLFGAQLKGELLQLQGLDPALNRLPLSNENQTFFGLAFVYLHPKSRGHVRLKSRNPLERPKIVSNYFSHPDDVVNVRESLKEAIRLGQSGALAKLGSKLVKDFAPGCEQYSNDSDEFWDCYIKRYILTGIHYGGTCKMGPDGDPAAVVNPELQVQGIDKLRVVDASVIPAPIAGHPNGAILMIGEKAADMVKKRWA